MNLGQHVQMLGQFAPFFHVVSYFRAMQSATLPIM
jgi:hypothetical protein